LILSLGHKLALALLVLPTLAWAGPPRLLFPLDCKIGKTCFIQQYVDRDPGPGAMDFTRGPLSYDGHKGTDIRVPFRRQIRGRGVAIRAAAAGIVIATRNVMPDIAQGEPGAPDVRKRECGNGVVLDIGAGWRTQYCHMRKGSVLVKKGAHIRQGQIIGQVGLSGLSQFPHVHFQLSKDGKIVDPFRPGSLTDGTIRPELWQDQIPYQAGGILGAGFGKRALTFTDIRNGPVRLDRLSPTAPALTLWGFFFGLQKGDTIELAITAPTGAPFITDTFAIKKAKASAFRMVGRKHSGRDWQKGAYQGDIIWRRQGRELYRQSVELTIK